MSRTSFQFIEPSVRIKREWLIAAEFIRPDGTPMRCWCGCSDFKEKPVAYDGNYVCEAEWICTQCDQSRGYWSYGHFIDEEDHYPEVFAAVGKQLEANQ